MLGFIHEIIPVKFLSFNLSEDWKDAMWISCLLAFFILGVINAFFTSMQGCSAQ